MILLVNDDGIQAPGLRALAAALRQRLRLPLLVVAPTEERSGASHAITIDRPLTATPVIDGDFFGFAVDGTPVDCVKLALDVLCPVAPRLVVSGINDGPNVGRSIHYSGTVSAAAEAAIEGHAALAFSRDREGASPWDDAATAAAALVAACLDHDPFKGRVVNCNLPGTPATSWGPARLVPHGRSGWKERYRQVQQPDGRMAWQLDGERHEWDDEGETDAHVLRRGAPALSILDADRNATRARRSWSWLLSALEARR